MWQQEGELKRQLSCAAVTQSKSKVNASAPPPPYVDGETATTNTILQGDRDMNVLISHANCTLS